MNKKILVLAMVCTSLFCPFILAGSLIDFEFGSGLVVPFAAGYETRTNNTFAININLTEDFTVAVFREDASVYGKNTYEAGTPEVVYTIVNEGNASVNGIRLMHVVPNLYFLTAGLEIGTIKFDTTNNFRRSNGTNGVPADWGLQAADPLDGSYPLVGILAKAAYKPEIKKLHSEVFASLSYRLVDTTETFALGAITANKTTPEEIESIKNFNNLTILVGFKIGF